MDVHVNLPNPLTVSLSYTDRLLLEEVARSLRVIEESINVGLRSQTNKHVLCTRTDGESERTFTDGA